MKEFALEFDQPWKIAVDLLLPDALTLCFPLVWEKIDWAIPHEAMDAELQKLAPGHQQGPLSVDRLFKVRLKLGEDVWLYVHIEIQAQRDGLFQIRMWTYHYRLFDRLGPKVISLAILADEDPNWRPTAYHDEFAGMVRHFEFPIFKVLDLKDAARVFEQTGNPFALLIAAHQAALETRKDSDARFRERLRLVKYLYRGGMERQRVRTLFRLIGWLTKLPADLELKFREELLEYEKIEKPMTIDTLLSPLEVILLQKEREKGVEEGRQEGQQEGWKRGRQEGLIEAVKLGLELRFGGEGVDLFPKVEQCSDLLLLTQAQDAIRRGRELEEIKRLFH